MVVDRSLSTNDASGANQPSKWSQIVAAIHTMVAEPTIDWGLKFDGDGDGVCGVSTEGVAVAVGPAHATLIDDALAASGGPRGGDPTAAAVTAAGAYLRSLPTDSPGYLLLITDGRPTCANGDATASDSSAATQAIIDQYQMGTSTFVMGVPSEGDSDAITTLRKMAVAGGHSEQSGTGYVPVAEAAAFVQPLQSLSRAVSTCTLTLPQVPPDPNNVKVFLNEQPVPSDANNGWQYTPDMRSIVLYGTFCDAALQGSPPGTSTTVRVVVGCVGGPI